MITTHSSGTDSHTELCSLPVAKSHLGVTGSSDDALLAEMIQSASQFIVDYTDRSYHRQLVTETLPATGRGYLVLTRTPVISVQLVTHSGTTISSTTYEIDNTNAGMLWRQSGWTDTSIYGNNVEVYNTGEGRREWSIKYTAGYITPGSTLGSRTLPYDVEKACLEIVKSWYKSKDDDPNVIIQKAGDASETKANLAGRYTGIPPVVITLLNPWRRVEI